ncbi:flagellar biosynthesis protein FlgA [Vallicoccus soli]|uniref:Flagellar biosynthesis protein FlgA n=1 Tax=Vallicoccus soli TaxID=2339232 RepID=A0A3A3Z4N9_9ACTN|nr:flagellar biosynthesis protein FlgA [Vallicoccus soli]
MPADLLRVLARHRLVLSAAAAAGAVAAALGALAPAPPPSTPVPVAARDLPAGQRLAAGDVTTVRLPPGAVPDGVVGEGALPGRVLGGPVRRGEPLTDARLLGPALLGPDADAVATALRVADPGALAVLGPGDLVDVHAAAAGPDGTAVVRTVAARVRVLAVPAAQPGDAGAAAGFDEGGLLVVAARPAVAAELAGAAATARLTVAVHGR